MKDIILERLNKLTNTVGLQVDKRLTANEIAHALQISRNSASQHLNELVKEGKVIKINTRPVYFYAKDVLDKKYYKLKDVNVYASFEDLQANYEGKKKNFEKLIGSSGSLYEVVNQCKAAIAYPPVGLPVLLHGATGTGKSFIASLMYEYAVDENIISDKSNFVSINCSEYANNPELLTSSLFGHVKGAFTGADDDNLGLISRADGGLLFLDEVHGLSAECQEKLFLFMDKGLYRPVGETEAWHKSSCRIVFATTYNPKDTLLATLLRRIPLTVFVPSLEERPLSEKRELIYSVLKNEEDKLHRSIYISNLVYQSLMDFNYVGNVGEMKNLMKAFCANAFLNTSPDSKNLEIKIHDLAEKVLAGFPAFQLKQFDNTNDVMIPLSKLKDGITENTPLINLYSKVIKNFENFKENDLQLGTLLELNKTIFTHTLDYWVFKEHYAKKANTNYMLKITDKIYSIVMNKYGIVIPNSEIRLHMVLFQQYAKQSVDAKVWISQNREIIEELKKLMYEVTPRIYTVANEIASNIELNLDIELDDMIIILLTTLLASVDKMGSSNSVGVIICHGYSTASSIAEAANQMIGTFVFDGLDMEIDSTVDKVVMQLNQYLKHKENIENLMLLVDMGSLEEMYKKVKPLPNCNIGLINNVSTALALDVGLKLLNGSSIDQILEDAKKEYTLATQFIEGRAKKEAVLAVCATGIGAAQKITELFQESLPVNIPIEIIPYEFDALNTNKENDPIFSQYNISVIMGTLDPQVESCNFIPVENILLDQDMGALEQMISTHLSPKDYEKFRHNVMKNFTLSNIVDHLTILNAKKVLEIVEEIVSELEESLQVELSVSRKTGLYVHISCLLERLMLRKEYISNIGVSELLENKPDFVEAVRNAFSVAEMIYSVEIPDSEIVFIENYFKEANK